MASFQQTIHASADGISLVRAADYAAMRGLLDIDGTLETFQRLRAHQRETTARVTIMFDDGYVDAYTAAKPVFDAQGEVGCIAMPSDNANQAGYLSTAQLLALEAAGWEICSHAKGMTQLTDLTIEQATTEITGSKTALEALGLQIENFVYPGHAQNAAIRAIVRQYYRSARGTLSYVGANLPVLETYALRTVLATDYTDGQLQAYVDAANTAGTWLIVYWHQVDETQATRIGTLIDYVQAASIPIVTMSEALDDIENVADFGDGFAASDTGANITGGVINEVTIGATTPGTVKATTVETTGRAGIGGAPNDNYTLYIPQLADDQGLALYGYDDQAAKYFHIYVSSGGLGYLYSNSSMIFYAAGGEISFYSAAGQGMSLVCGNLFSFKDMDAAEAVRLTINSATGELAIPSNTVGLMLDASGTTTLYSDGTSIIINKPLTLGGDLDCNGNTIHFGTAENEAAINTTPSPNTCTVNLHAENHWTIPANDADDDITATITVPPGPTAGSILIEQGATPRDITWVASAGTIAWLGTEPTWNDASEASEIHAVTWRWNGTYLLMSDAGKTSLTP